MGFSNIVSQVVLFMSIMIVIVVLSVVYKTYVTTTNLSLKIQQEKAVAKIDTSFKILNGTYDSLDNNVLVYLENTGSIKMDPKYIDVMVDNERLSRNSTNRVVELVASTNLINFNLWDPGELIKINVSKTLAQGAHLIRVSVENGIMRSIILEA